jgi:hypothetical protein
VTLVTAVADAQRTLTEGRRRSTRNPDKKGKSTSGLAMTTSSEDSVELEAKVATTPRLSRHRVRRRKRIAARILIILALVIGVLAISDFVYNAAERASGFGAISVVDEDGRRVVNNADADTIDALRTLNHFDDLMQLDSAALLLAAACAITSTVVSRRMKRHRR